MLRKKESLYYTFGELRLLRVMEGKTGLLEAKMDLIEQVISILKWQEHMSPTKG